MLKFNLFQYSEKAAKEILKALKTKDAKSIQGTGRFKVIASCETLDRDGEMIMVEGWDFANYIKNPVILWGHNYWDMNAIIGACDKISIEEIDGVKCLVQEGLFANTTEGQKARQLYDDGMLKTVSVGFIPKERNGNIITKQELLELSFCAVPSNPDAVSLEKFAKDMMTRTLTIIQDKGDIKSLTVDLEKGLAVQAADAIIKELNERFIKADGKAPESLEPTPPLKTAEEDEQAKQIDELKAKVTALEVEAKSGRVLSAKNLALVDSAIEALTALRDATEPEKAALVDAAKNVQLDSQGLVKVLEKIIKNSKLLTSNI